MVICHCLGVNDNAVRRAVHDHGAADLESVAAACGAGSICGGCRPAVADVMVSCGVSVVAVRLRSAGRRSTGVSAGRSTGVSAPRQLQATSAA